MPKVEVPELPKLPEPDPAIEAAKKAELERTEKERLAEIQKRLRQDTAASSSKGTGKKSLLTKGTTGFATRALLGK